MWCYKMSDKKDDIIKKLRKVNFGLLKENEKLKKEIRRIRVILKSFGYDRNEIWNEG